MLGRIAAVVMVFTLVSCAEVSSAPGTGGGGAGNGGVGGQAGIGGEAGVGGQAGIGGEAGVGGVGGTGGIALDPCTPNIKEFANIEPDDMVGNAPAPATGSVNGTCAAGSCTGLDPFDRWSVAPICRSKYRIDLTWEDVKYDLDLYLSDSDDQQIAQSANPNTTSESISAALEDQTFYIIEVQAFDTNATAIDYELSVVPID
jgi:hypothetical protein